ncbi:MAG TPA: hypothetical protein VMX14_12270, partial [Anaerolineae bacterium]|nr:hypothetical protein [Anaerolineae bacterium]
AVAFAALFRLAADDLRELLPFFAIRDHSCSRRHGLGTCPAITRPDRASVMLPWSPHAAQGPRVRCL